MGGANGVTCAVESVRPLAFSSEEAAKLIGVARRPLQIGAVSSKGRKSTFASANPRDPMFFIVTMIMRLGCTLCASRPKID